MATVAHTEVPVTTAGPQSFCLDVRVLCELSRAGTWGQVQGWPPRPAPRGLSTSRPGEEVCPRLSPSVRWVPGLGGGLGVPPLGRCHHFSKSWPMFPGAQGLLPKGGLDCGHPTPPQGLQSQAFCLKHVSSHPRL